MLYNQAQTPPQAVLGRRSFARPGWKNANTAQGLLGARALTANPFGAGRWTRHRAPQSARRTRKRDRKPRPQRKKAKKEKGAKALAAVARAKAGGDLLFCRQPDSCNRILQNAPIGGKKAARDPQAIRPRFQPTRGMREAQTTGTDTSAAREKTGTRTFASKRAHTRRVSTREMVRRREALSARARTVSGLSAGGTSRKAALRRPTSADDWTAGEPDTGRAQKHQRGEQKDWTGAKAARGWRAGRPGRREGGQIRPLAVF